MSILGPTQCGIRVYSSIRRKISRKRVSRMCDLEKWWDQKVNCVSRTCGLPAHGNQLGIRQFPESREFGSTAKKEISKKGLSR